MTDLNPPFFTGRVLSPEDPIAIPPGTAVAAFSATQQNSKYRTWALLAAANPANIPANLYRGSLMIDNVTSTEAAIVSQGGITIFTVAAGAREELCRPPWSLGTEAFTVTMAGTTANACVVSERSYL